MNQFGRLATDIGDITLDIHRNDVPRAEICLDSDDTTTLGNGSSGSTADVVNRVDAIKDDSGGLPGTSLSQYTYLGGGRIVVEDYVQPDVKLNYDSGTAGTYAGFDRFGRVVQQLWYDYGASTNRDKFTYGYDRASNRLYRENTVASGRDEFYSYDDANRLATFDRGNLNAGKTAIDGTPASEEDWGLDMTGNWSDFTQKTSGSTDLNQDRTHNDVNEITGISETVGTAWIDPVHDKAGNMTTLPNPSNPASGLTCKWDAWNHLVEVKDGATVVAKYEYDGLARRTKKHVDSESPVSPNGIDAYVHFFYNAGWQVLEERNRTVENTLTRIAPAEISIRLVAALHRRGHLARRQHRQRQSLRMTRVSTTWATPTSTSPH